MSVAKTARRMLLAAGLVVVCIVVLAAVVLVAGRTDETVEALGMVAPRTRLDVAPEIGGIVASVPVSEGQAVSQGDTLLVIRSEELEFRVAEAERVLAERSASLKRAIDEYHNMTASRSYEIGMVLADLNDAEKRVAYYKANLDRWAALHAKGLVDDAEYEKAKLDYESSKSYLEVLKSRRDILKRQYERTIDEHRLDLEIAQQSYELALRNLEGAVVRSPIDGAVLTRRPERLEGRRVTAGEPVISVGDLGDLCFVANLSESSMADVREGLRAKVFLNSYPHRQYKVFEGRVRSVSTVPQITGNVVAYEVVIDLLEPWVEREGRRVNLAYGLTGRVEIVTRPDVRLLDSFLRGLSG